MLRALDSNEFLVDLYEVINQATNVINESHLTLAQKSQLDSICDGSMTITQQIARLNGAIVDES